MRCKMIKAWAIVDKANEKNHWNVQVHGQPPYDYFRIYTIKAKSDNDAAQEGLRRFVEEVETLGPEDKYTCH